MAEIRRVRAARVRGLLQEGRNRKRKERREARRARFDRRVRQNWGRALDALDELISSAIAHPEAGALLRKLMAAQGLAVQPMGRTLESICITEACE